MKEDIDYEDLELSEEDDEGLLTGHNEEEEKTSLMSKIYNGEQHAKNALMVSGLLIAIVSIVLYIPFMVGIIGWLVIKEFIKMAKQGA
ncbi:hypothetical protein LN840_004683 [Escherichia coli]|nr:hypothetical protein [Escherichia coli]